MADSKNTLFSIGQFAALHEINKKTLMWYDEIGLFKPAVVKENGYRYYTYYQSAALETILMLRKLNVSISEIQDFMKNRSAKGLKVLLEEKIVRLDQELAQMQAIRQMMRKQVDTMTMLTALDIWDIAIVELQEQYLATVPVSGDISMEKEIELMMAEARRQQVSSLCDATYGSMILAESLYGGRFEEYTGLFMVVRTPSRPERLFRKPAGQYLRAFYKGSWDGLPARYQEILAWAEASGYRLTGCVYEMGINEIVTDSMEEYITQIEVAVSRLTPPLMLY